MRFLVSLLFCLLAAFAAAAYASPVEELDPAQQEQVAALLDVDVQGGPENEGDRLARQFGFGRGFGGYRRGFGGYGGYGGFRRGYGGYGGYGRRGYGGFGRYGGFYG